MMAGKILFSQARSCCDTANDFTAVDRPMKLSSHGTTEPGKNQGYLKMHPEKVHFFIALKKEKIVEREIIIVNQSTGM
jgi:hypothetical protein